MKVYRFPQGRLITFKVHTRNGRSFVEWAHGDCINWPNWPLMGWFHARFAKSETALAHFEKRFGPSTLIAEREAA